MAYLGDEEVTAALIAAANRGVEVTFLFSREANIGNDLNYRTIHEIFTGAPVAVHLTDTMIHAKLMLFDDDDRHPRLGQPSVFSLQKAGELDLVVRDSGTLATLRDVIARRLADAELGHGLRRASSVTTTAARRPPATPPEVEPRLMTTGVRPPDDQRQ